ncbi:MAG: glycosyltransferase family 39 protein, partial [Clostridia bacterium]|nr:glycosyltransferase family 39 protein [Clostridia bacterium]
MKNAESRFRILALAGSGRRSGRMFVLAFFSVLFLAGLLVSGDYGLPCDEPAEQAILRENLKEYALQIGGPESEASRYYDGLNVRRISESIEKDHGQCAYYLAAPILQVPDGTLRTVLWHGYTWLWFMAGVIAAYGFGREMGMDRLSACAAALLLYLSPRFFAEGHYNNKDIVLLSLVLLSLWMGLRLLKKQTLLRGILFSLAGAMAANTKVVGMLPWALTALSVVILISARKAWTGRRLAVAMGTAAAFLAGYGLLTPALWPDPAAFFAHAIQNASGFSRWTGVVVFRGMVFDHPVNPLPRYYLPYMILVTLPLYTLPLAALGQGVAVLRVGRQGKSALLDEKTLALLVLSLSWMIPLGFVMAARPLVYNGWRHFYFLFAGLALLAGYGLQILVKAAGQKKKAPWARWAAYVLLCGCFVSTAVQLIVNHPFQYGYYNILRQGMAATQMELDYWDVSTVNAMKLLCEAGRDERQPLRLGSRDEMSF